MFCLAGIVSRTKKLVTMQCMEKQINGRLRGLMVYSLEVEKVDMKRYCMRFTKESIPENWKEATLQSSPKGIFGGLLELQKKYRFLCPAGDVFSRSILQRLIEVLVVVFKNQQRNYSKISHLLIINYNYSNHGGVSGTEFVFNGYVHKLWKTFDSADHATP